MSSVARRPETFRLILIKPSHYDDEGYVIQWWRTQIPSNSLAALYALARDCRERRALGDYVNIEIETYDETNTRIRPQQIIQALRRSKEKALIGLVGVQSNQFPRAMDLAREFRAAEIPVCIGGFHAAGSLNMLPEPPTELHEAWDLGISIFAGEAEGRLDGVLLDAYKGKMKPLYDYLKDLPGLEGAVTPFLPRDLIERHQGVRTSFDSGRGCPFQCSFCTIINVQGRKSRYRTADDIEHLVRENYAVGIRKFFITDDNFARNRNWEQIFDRLIKLRKRDGIDLKLIIQVDTLCHRIPNFVKKAGLAGVRRVFIGLENINPDNLAAAKKKQNRITEYREMLLAWRSIGAVTYCGYITGFPGDTRESILRDLEILKRELPVDILEFFFLTPLPGSEDHQRLHRTGIPMDPDLNKYDLEHVTTAHPRMSAVEWRRAYDDAWDSFYSLEHVETLMRRAHASGMSMRRIARMCFAFHAGTTIEKVHPLQCGAFRFKFRKDRRPGLPIESPFVFYPRYLWSILSKYTRAGLLAYRYYKIAWRIEKDPKAAEYTDIALTPVSNEEVEELEMFTGSAAAKGAVERAKKLKTLRPVA